MTEPETYNRIVTIGVDIQNDFCPGGALGVTEGDTVIEPFNRVAAWTRQHNGIVALTRDWHPQQTKHFDTWPPHCVAGTHGAELHKDVAAMPQDMILNKGTGTEDDAYSGFEATGPNGETLVDLITPEQNERVAVLIGGLATDYCVKATVLDALAVANQGKYIAHNHRIDVYVLADAINAVGLQADDEEKAITEMKLHGAYFTNTQHIIDGQLTVEEQ